MTRVPAPAARPATLQPLHRLLGAQSAVILLGSLNRLGPWTQGYVADNQFLRWVDFHNMLTLPLVSVVALYLLKKEVTRSPARGGTHWSALLNVLFVVGLYLVAASYGSHETTNYLNQRFCSADSTTDLCRIVAYNDDTFSHWLFFIGFALLNGVLMLLQHHHPWPGTLTRRDDAWLAFNAAWVALGIFANLGFETIGLDLFVVLALALLAGVLLWRDRRQPLPRYYALAYGVGLIATALYRLAA